jgi:hypothetical protein
MPTHKSECCHTIRLIDDESFERTEVDRLWTGDSSPLDLWSLDINQGNWEKTVHILPIFKENEHNTELFKLKLYCERENIQLVSHGRLNQLPLLSQLSDRVVLDGGASMNSLYTESSHYCTRQRRMEKDERFWKCAKEISDEEVVEKFKSTTLCIRRSSYEFFLKENFPKRLVVAEIRLGNDQQKKYVEKNSPVEITGLDYEFQRSLVKRSNHHYMSLQVLGSLLNQWSWICGGGSANLFCLLPVNCLILTEAGKMFRPSTRNIIRKLAQNRFAELGAIVPIIDTSTQWTRQLNITKRQWGAIQYASKHIKQNVIIEGN